MVKRLFFLLLLSLVCLTLLAQQNVSISTLITDLNTNGSSSPYVMGSPSLRIQGYVTIGADRINTLTASSLQAYVQEYSAGSPGYGIQVYRSSMDATIRQTFTRGNFVEVVGTVTIESGNYAGGYRFTTTTSSVREDGNPDSFVYDYLATPLTIAEANNYAANHGKFALVTGAVVERWTAGGGDNIVIEEWGTRILFRVMERTTIDTSPYQVGTRVNVYGAIYPWHNNPPITAQLWVGYPGDVSLNTDPPPPPPPPPPSEFDNLNGKLRIAPRPYNIYENEKVGIQYYAEVGSKVILRIYNSEGKLVSTPVNKVFSAANGVDEVKWDGRNNEYRLVEPGLYIAHLEVLDRVSGKQNTSQAPIVVGTRLK